MKQNKIIIALLCVLCAAGCELVKDPSEPPKKTAAAAISKLNPDGEKIIRPGIFKGDCIYGLNGQSISDHAPVIYGKTGTWNIGQFANSDLLGSNPGYYIHKFKTSKDGTLIDSKGNNAIPGEKGEGSGRTANSSYPLRLTALANKIKEIFNEKSLDSLALQEIPLPDVKDNNNVNMLNHLTEALKPLKLIPPNKYAGENDVPDTALVVKEGSPIVAQLNSSYLRAQAYCDEAKKECIVSTHLAGGKTFVDPKSEEYDAKVDEKLIPVCKELEKFAESLKELQFKVITYIGDFNVSAQKIKRACKWHHAPVIRSYEGEGSSCSDNKGSLTPENIDILIEFNY